MYKSLFILNRLSKKIKNFLPGLLALALMTGCNDDDNNSEEFSDLTVEQHKANIEQTGIDVLHQLDDLRVGNLKLQGVANWEGLRNAEGQFEDVETEKAFYEEMANVMNDNVKMYVKYNDKNEIIAASEFYALERSDEYGSYWDFSMRMKFSDGSYMDESFFTEENFPGFFQEAEKFISDIETNYGLTLQ